MLIVRIIKTQECSICEMWLPRLDQQGFLYETFDADALGNQKQLDEWKIDDLPVVQIVNRANDDTETVKYQFAPGSWSVRAIKHKMSQVENESK